MTMSRYLLDASFILDVLKGGSSAFDMVQFIRDGEHLTSVLCYCEVLNVSSEKKQATAKEFLSNLTVLPLTLKEGGIAEKLQYDCRRQGRHVKTMDCLIAATAINHDASVVATDSDFTRIQGLKSHVF